MRRLVPFLAGALLGLIPLSASAYNAYTSITVNLRAGPSYNYPVVAVIPMGTSLNVWGCVPGYSWCDVSVFGERGWVYAANIDAFYQGVAVPVINYGPALGFAVFSFILSDYWNHHYRDRPWYHDRAFWGHQRRPPPARPRSWTRAPGRVGSPQPMHPPEMRLRPYSPRPIGPQPPQREQWRQQGPRYGQWGQQPPPTVRQQPPQRGQWGGQAPSRQQRVWRPSRGGADANRSPFHDGGPARRHD